MVTPVLVNGLALEIVTGRDEPVLGFAPASRKKPIPVLNYRLRAEGPARLAWVLTPYRDARPDVEVTAEDRDGGTVVTVSHAGGSDFVYVAQRGEEHSVTLAGSQLRGRVGLVRTNETGEVVRSDVE